MCQSAIDLVTNALPDVGSAEVLLKVKGVVALFIQTMEVGAVIFPLFLRLKTNS